MITLIGEHKLVRSIPENCTFIDLTTEINVRKLRYLYWMITIRRIVSQIQPEILHSLGVASDGWLGAASGFHPFLISAFGSDLLLLDKRSRFHKILSRWALKQADQVVCVSQELAKKAVEFGVPKKRLEVVHLGVDTRVFFPADNPARLRTELGLPADPLVLSIRPVAPLYRPLDLANAIPLVLKQIPNAHFVILTYHHDPGTFSNFQQVINQNRADHAVQYIDDLPDDTAIANHYRATDVSVSLAESDGTPISVLEAMACGSAIIAGDLPTLHDWIRHEQEALFVPVGDTKAIAAAIVRLLSDPNLRVHLGQNALTVIQERGDAQYWSRRSIEIYQNLITGYS